MAGFFPSFVCAEPAGSTVTFSSAVNWDFKRLEKLDAWRNTAQVIQKSLARWYPSSAISGATVENAPPETWQAFFRQLTAANTGGLSVVYLAGHQTRDGQWQFPRDAERPLAALLPRPAASVKTHRFVIVDACFAESADVAGLMMNLGANGVLFSALHAEEAHEVHFHRRFPVDLTRRYPAEAQWLREALGPDWNGRVSFLGLVWTRAFLSTAHAPRNDAEWSAFLLRCETIAREFRHGRAAALASTFRLVANPAKIPSPPPP